MSQPHDPEYENCLTELTKLKHRIHDLEKYEIREYLEYVNTIFSGEKTIKLENTDVSFIGDDTKQQEFIKNTLLQIIPKNIIGGGANGTVYRTDYNDKKYAVKRISNNNVEYKLLAHTLDESKNCSEKIVCFKGYFTFEGHISTIKYIYIVTEYNDEFKDFGDQMNSSNNKNKYLITWIQPLYEAIQEIHEKQMIHRDIKWDNVIVNNDLTQIKLIDFDSACIKFKRQSLATNLDTDNIPLTTKYNQNVRNLECKIDFKGSPLFMNPKYYQLTYKPENNDTLIDEMKNIDLWAFGLFIFRFFSVKMKLFERIYQPLYFKVSKQLKMNPYGNIDPFTMKKSDTDSGYMFNLSKLGFFFDNQNTTKINHMQFINYVYKITDFTRKISDINKIDPLLPSQNKVSTARQPPLPPPQLDLFQKFRIIFVQSLFYMFKSIDAELSTNFGNKIPSMNELVPLFNETLYNVSTIIPPEYQIAEHVAGYSTSKEGGRRKSRRRKHKKRHTKKKRSYKNKKKSRHTK